MKGSWVGNDLSGCLSIHCILCIQNYIIQIVLFWDNLGQMNDVFSNLEVRVIANCLIALITDLDRECNTIFLPILNNIF